MRFPNPDDDLEAEFPLGDGTAESVAIVTCPYCGEPVEIGIDPGGGARQQYIEDCQICCQPWRLTVEYQPDGTVQVQADPID